jgi:uncharacterized protein YecE (DUF72 family)
MIRIGTCSWTEKSLLKSGEFYPREVKTAEGRLRYYASNFPTVEVDSTYYALPDRKNTSLWAVRTPDHFIFHIKAYGALTGHGVDPRTLPNEVRSMLTASDTGRGHVYIKDPSLIHLIAERFKDGLIPLLSANKLGLLVLQFPPWFRHEKRNFDFMLKCRDIMAGFALAAEFRHGSWLTPRNLDSTLNFLRDHRFTFIVADEPQYRTLATVPFCPQLTSETAYFRFHGRNTKNWLRKGIETSLRYAYDYSDAEFNDFIPSIQDIAAHADVTYAMFNNCHGGFAMKNALRLKTLLGTGARGDDEEKRDHTTPEY